MAVVKIGGSLLAVPDFARRLRELRDSLAGGGIVIVCGGGETADIVRRWQPLHGLSDEQAHWLALRAVSVNELLTSQLLPHTVIVRTREEMAAAWDGGRVPILSVEHFLRQEEPHATTLLPHDWSATSDSIAAWVTRRLNGRRLILIKSCDLPAGVLPEVAAASGLVDGYFPVAALGLSIDWLNLRADEPRLTEWTRGAIGPSSGVLPA